MIGKLLKIWSGIIVLIGIGISYVYAYTLCEDNVETTVAFLLGSVGAITVALLIYGFGHLITRIDEIGDRT